MKLYEKDLPGEFSLKNNFSDSAYDEFLDKLEKDYPELVPYFKDKDNYGYGSWFYVKALNFYSENKGDMDFGNIDKFVKDFLETEGKYIIKNLNKEKEKNDKLIAARKTGKVDGKKVWHWEYENDDDGTIQKFKTDGINPVNGTYDGVYESTKLSIKEAKEILKNSGYRVLKERKVNLDNLVKNIFELLTSYDIEASNNEVKKLVWNYIDSGRDAEHASAEDVIEFDLDNEPDSVLKYNGGIHHWIKEGRYNEYIDESVQMNEDTGEPASSSSKQNEVVLLDTDASKYTLDDVRDWKEDDSIEEDSEEYWDAVNDMIDLEIEDFRTNAAFDFDLGECLVMATAGLWNGHSDGAGIRTITFGQDILNCLSKDCDQCRVVLNENGLVMYGYHHGGTNVYTFYKLNNKGVEYWEKHEDDYNESKILQNLIRGKMVKKITKDMIGY